MPGTHLTKTVADDDKQGHRLYHNMGVLANEVEVNGKRPPEPSVVVGFAFMAKKMDSMAKVGIRGNAKPRAWL